MATHTCTQPDTIAAPTSVAASTGREGFTEVSWVSPTNINYRSVELWYSTSSSGTYTLLTSFYGEPATAKRVPIGLPSGLVAGTTYYFKLRSVNIYGSQSAYTSPVSGSFIANSIDVADGSITTAKLASLAVTTAKIAADAVTATQIGDDAVTTAQLAADSVTAAIIAADAVGTSELATNAVTAAIIAADAVGTSELAANSVTAAIIAADAVSTSELAASAVTTAILADDAVNNAKIATDAVQGDVIAASAITTTKIADDAIETAKIAANAITASEIAANAVTANEINANAVTTAKLAAGAVTADEIGANAVTAVKIISGAITAAKIDTGAVTAEKILADAVTAVKIVAGAVTTAKLDAGAVTADKIGANEVTSAKILAGAVTAAKIDSGAVTTAKLDAGAVTAAKITSGTITAAQIDSGTITASEIASGTITAGNLGANCVTTAKLDALAVEAGNIAASAITTDKLNAGAVTAAKVTAASLTVDRIESGTSTTQSNLLFGFGAGATIGGVGAAGVFGSTVSTALGLIVVANGPDIGLGVANAGGDAGDYAIVGYGDTNTSYTTAVTSGALGNNVFGVQGYYNSTNKFGRLGLSSYGVYSGGDVYTTGSYLPFTGSHDALLPKATSVEVGDILVDTGVARKTGVSETLSYVDKSSSASQKSVIGVYQSNAPSGSYPVTLSREKTVGSGMNEFKDNELDPDYASLLTSHDYIYTNSLGEGQVNVCGESGDIAIGDLIVSSGTAGKGMKQSDDVIRSSTVCKAREAITFAQASDTGQIACIYLCG